MHCQGNSSRRVLGFSTLEFSLVLPVLVILSLGLMDITHLVRSYTALQEGVRTSLRCAYTTHGDCVDTVLLDREPEFEVTSYPVITNIAADYERYSGTERFLLRPEFERSNFTADVLSQVSYNYTEDRWRVTAQEVDVAGEGDIPSVSMLSAKSPYIQWTGDEPGEAILRFKESGGAYPFQSVGWTRSGQVAKIQNPDGSTTLQSINLGASAPFSIARPANLLAGENCFVSTNLDNQNGTHSPSASTCGEYFGDTDFFKAVVWIKGHSQGSNNGAEANVTADIEVCDNFSNGTCHSGWGPFQDIAGRHYSSTPGRRDASLVPRGIPSGDYQDPFPAGFTWNETTTHQITFKFGETYRFKLRLEANNDSPVGAVARYQGTGIQVFRPRFAAELGSTEDCTGRFQFSNPPSGTCGGVSGRTLQNARIKSGTQQVIASHSVEDLTSPPSNPEQVISSQVNPLDCVNVQVQEYDKAFNNVMRSCPAIGATNGQGGAANYGVSQSPQGGVIPGSNVQARAICPAPTGVQNLVYNHFTEVNAPIPGNPHGTYVKQNCFHNPTDSQVVPELLPYKKVRDGEESFWHGKTLVLAQLTREKWFQTIQASIVEPLITLRELSLMTHSLPNQKLYSTGGSTIIRAKVMKKKL